MGMARGMAKVMHNILLASLGKIFVVAYSLLFMLMKL
jgi:hypothetical protein